MASFLERKLGVLAMILHRLVGLPAAAALLFAPAVVQAQSCGALLANRASADQDGRQLTEENPGTAVVALACIAVASSNYDQTQSVSDAVGTFGLCGGIGCAFIGGDCLSIGSRMIYDAMIVYSLDKAIRQQGCNQ